MKFYYFAAATLLFAVLVCARQKPFRENMHTIHRDFKYRRITQGFEKIAKMLKKLPSRRRSEAAMEFFKLGITEHSDGHFNTAMKMYKIVSPHLDKESRANAFSNLGLIYREFKGDKAVALSYFEKAVEEIPTHRNALRMAAQVYHEMKFFSSALRFYRLALDIQPEDSMVLANMCDIQRQMKNYTKAKQLCENAIKIDPNAALAQSSLAMLLVHEAGFLPTFSDDRKQKMGKAKQLAGLALTNKPGLVTVWSNYAEVAKSMDDTSTAKKAYVRARDLQPQNPTGYHNIGNLELYRGNMLEASDAYRLELQYRLSFQHSQQQCSEDKGEWKAAAYAWGASINDSDKRVEILMRENKEAKEIINFSQRKGNSNVDHEDSPHVAREFFTRENGGLVSVQQTEIVFNKTKWYGVGRIMNAYIQNQHGTVYKGCKIYLGGHSYLAGVKNIGFRVLKGKMHTIDLHDHAYATLVSFNMRNYFHFIVEALSRFVIFEQYFSSQVGLAENLKYIVPNRKHAVNIMKILGVPDSKIHWYDGTDPSVRLHVRELYLADWFTSTKDTLDDPYVSPTHLFLPPTGKSTMASVRKNLIAASHIEPSTRAEILILYVQRARVTVSHRRVDNEDEILDSLREFRRSHSDVLLDVVDPGSMKVEAQVALFSRAGVIIGPHGAGLTNALFARKGSALIEFPVKDAKFPYYNYISKVAGLKHWVVPELSCSGQNNFFAGKKAVEALMRTLQYAYEDVLATRSKSNARDIGNEL